MRHPWLPREQRLRRNGAAGVVVATHLAHFPCPERACGWRSVPNPEAIAYTETAFVVAIPLALPRPSRVTH
jgi:hypothetical protein